MTLKKKRPKKDKKWVEQAFVLAQKMVHLKKKNLPEQALLKKTAQIGGYNPQKNVKKLPGIQQGPD